MPTVLVDSILTRAANVLQDPSSTRWPKDELLGWLNDAQREVILVRPDAYTRNKSHDLVGASTRQTLPNDALKLTDIVCNVGGPSITSIERRVLDEQHPDWHLAEADSVVHYIYDERDPKTFYVYPAPSVIPPNTATNPPTPGALRQVSIVYYAAPRDVDITEVLHMPTTAEIAAGAAPLDDRTELPMALRPTTLVLTPGDNIYYSIITLDDIFANAILDFILYRAYSKDADYAANAGRAQGHYQAFLNSLGVKASTDAQNLLMTTTNDGTPGNAVVPQPTRPR
jgi:hypothetical protein